MDYRWLLKRSILVVRIRNDSSKATHKPRVFCPARSSQLFPFSAMTEVRNIEFKGPILRKAFDPSFIIGVTLALGEPWGMFT
jgi:hypothetical protein